MKPLSLLFILATATFAVPLPSWNDTAPKKAIIAFVEKVTTAGSPDYVVPAERIATFDNDGTLWCEQPMYVQAFFVFDSIKRMAPQHPDWKDQKPFVSVLKGDMKTALAGGEKALVGMLMATHSGMTTDEFEKSVTDWLVTAKHPKTGKMFAMSKPPHRGLDIPTRRLRSPQPDPTRNRRTQDLSETRLVSETGSQSRRLMGVRSDLDQEHHPP